jgi:hypothetical protein
LIAAAIPENRCRHEGTKKGTVRRNFLRVFVVGDTAKISVRRLLKHRFEPLRRGKAHRRHQREQTEHAGHHAAAQMRRH